MKVLRMIVALGLSIAALCGSTPSVWAGSGTGGDCLTTNPGPSNLALKGTMVVEVLATDLAANLASVPMDAMLRLVKGGIVRFFYVNIPSIQPGTNEQIVCAVLDAMKGALRQGFNLPQTTAFCITDKSLSNADGGTITPFDSINIFDESTTPPTLLYVVPPRVLSGADVTVYALPGPTCPQ